MDGGGIGGWSSEEGGGMASGGGGSGRGSPSDTAPHDNPRDMDRGPYYTTNNNDYSKFHSGASEYLQHSPDYATFSSECDYAHHSSPGYNDAHHDSSSYTDVNYQSPPSCADSGYSDAHNSSRYSDAHNQSFGYSDTHNNSSRNNDAYNSSGYSNMGHHSPSYSNAHYQNQSYNDSHLNQSYSNPYGGKCEYPGCVDHSRTECRGCRDSSPCYDQSCQHDSRCNDYSQEYQPPPKVEVTAKVLFGSASAISNLKQKKSSKKK